ncbi:hypothetical protein [Iningainema tapete]|uniref:Uncharacterized protein n=1 Tax=Iningainema tapete BLCC-T55 TaxID=2748662 RepID=A0A8J6XLN6_9CYAN|nr:hypothetical protein [Iningainema tapete]MBD2778644.1 hypothetical protein [Iningainema tapete BLCC-T55]
MAIINDIKMPVKKSSKSKKTPPSQMLRVPTPLIEAVKELSRLHRLGQTNAVLLGLQSLISNIDSNTDSDIGASETVKQLQLRLEKLESRFDSDIDSKSILKSVTNLEEKLEALTTRLAQLEGAMMVLQRNNSGAKRSSRSYPNQYYQREAPQLQPFEEKNLALRLVTDVATLRQKRETMTEKEFVRWCKDRDPSSMGWRYEEKDKLYYPVK